MLIRCKYKCTDLLLEGNTIGGVYWTRTKPEQKVESEVLGSHEEQSNILDTLSVSGDQLQCHNKLNSVASAYGRIVYGLPHISLV